MKRRPPLDETLVSTYDEIDLAIADLAVGRAVGEAGQLLAEAARAHLQTDAGPVMLKRRAIRDRDQVLLDLAGKTVAQSRSRIRETSGLHQKRPNSHESGYGNPSQRYPNGIRFYLAQDN